MGKQKIDLTGQIFGKLTVIKQVFKDDRKAIFWECLCDCGKITVIRSESIRKGRTKSCGCLQKIKATTHGATKHPLFRIYNGMMERCYYLNHKGYENYGGRGITVCDRWRESFYNFVEDVATGYVKGLQLDRIDNDGNYEPDNVRWATHQQNAMNRRGNKNTTSKYKGVYRRKDSNRWFSSIKKDGKLIYIGSFLEEKEAAKAYNEKAIELFGEYAYLNIIEE